ncbi:MAG: response regulator [Flavobacteriaceae bacterium]|nr:response regulator [Flavobacteriaceae bacterium]
MSRIKYYILVIFVIFFTFGNAQTEFESDSLYKSSEIKLAIHNAELEEDRGNYYEAINILEKALEISKKIEDKKNVGIIYSRIAKLQYNVDDLDTAKEYVTRAIDAQYEIDDKLNQAVSRYIYGLIFLKDNQIREALDHFKSSKTIFEEERLDELIPEVTLNEAKAHIRLNDLNEANALLDKTVVLATKHDLPLVESSALITSGHVALLQGKFERALSQTMKGSAIAENNNAKELLNRSYKVLSDIYSTQGDHQKASENLRAYINLNDEILSEKRELLSPDKKFQLEISDKDAVIHKQAEEINKQNEATSLNKLTTILSVALITILSLLTLSLYKNNNIRLKTNNMLYKKNEELLTEKERAEIAAKTKANFLSTVTHELRTPLYAVTGLTNMLLEEEPKPEQIQHLKSLKFSGDYLLTFINDILQINKIEANKVELDPEVFNLKNKVENVIAALSNQAIDNNIAIHFEYEKHLPEVFNGDQLKISQILINLIGNSIKFTKDGDIWVRVKKNSKKGKTYNVTLEVEDNGIGISDEKQQHMFDSFSQGSVQINRKYGGTGLGLSIVKGLVEILHGSINLKSNLGEGTTFFVEVPLEETKETVRSQKTEISKKLNKLDLTNVNILVVEDNKINQMITKKILNKMNLKCEIVDNGEDAVEKVRGNGYDVVLMDIHMPGISGIEATKRIRSFDKAQTIFALTAVTLEDKMQEFEEAGFDDIISKPFKQEDFEKKLFSALSNRKSSAEV